MKHFFILTFLFLVMGGVFYVNAQDLIILKNGNVIEAKVLEISPTEIRYKRFDHLEGPTIVIMAIDVLSIRYENGRTEIINSVSQPATTTPSVSIPSIGGQTANQPNLNPRLNTIGATLGYQGVSAFGFTLNGTVSPANYTFFDFNLGLGFNSFAVNGRINFNAYVPFKFGGWYAGAGIGGGYNELLGGVFAGNITTGFILFNWLNIAYTLQIGTFDEIVNHNIAVGYSYRFNKQQDSEIGSKDNNSTASLTIPPYGSYVVERVIGQVQMEQVNGGRWVNVRRGDILNNNTRVRTYSKSSLVLSDGTNRVTIPSENLGRLDSLIMIYK